MGGSPAIFTTDPPFWARSPGRTSPAGKVPTPARLRVRLPALPSPSVPACRSAPGQHPARGRPPRRGASGRSWAEITTGASASRRSPSCSPSLADQIDDDRGLAGAGRLDRETDRQGRLAASTLLRNDGNNLHDEPSNVLAGRRSWRDDESTRRLGTPGYTLDGELVSGLALRLSAVSRCPARAVLPARDGPVWQAADPACSPAANRSAFPARRRVEDDLRCPARSEPQDALNQVAMGVRTSSEDAVPGVAQGGGRVAAAAL